MMSTHFPLLDHPLDRVGLEDSSRRINSSRDLLLIGSAVFVAFGARLSPGRPGSAFSMRSASSSVGFKSPRSIALYRLELMPRSAARSCCRNPAAILRSFQAS
jgi:hypothetical protein